jgi:hypothetical protein
MKRKHKAPIDKELEEFYRELERKKRRMDFITLIIVIFFFGVFVGAMLMRFQYNIW